VESNWKNKISNLALATSVTFKSLDLKENEEENTSKKKELFSAIINDEYDTKDELIDINYHQIISKNAPDVSETCMQMSGREVVTYLIKSNHLGVVKAFHLNVVPSRDFRPYDLITVPKSQVKEETKHYESGE
jgi:hypothetical protein